MERKSIGQFIAALRKANGLTQKQLADKLNLSDKTVSRWERDETAPDISLIPVIADIFGVTCDELLCGERKINNGNASGDEEVLSAKGEKQRRRLLTIGLSQFKNKSIISCSIAAVGLIAALICNFAFTRAYLGFFIAILFYLAALVCQIIFVNKVFVSVADDEYSDNEILDFKRSAVRIAEYAISLIIVLIFFTLALVLNHLTPVGAYAGIWAETWLFYGAIYGVVGLIICILASNKINSSLAKKGVITDTNNDKMRRHNFYLGSACAAVLAVSVFLTYGVYCAVTDDGYWPKFADGIIFEDYESFSEFIEQDVPSPGMHFYSNDQSFHIEMEIESEDDEYVDPDESSDEYYEMYIESFFDEVPYGIYDDVARIVIKNIDGNTVVDCVRMNNSVVSIEYGDAQDGFLPIKVVTADETIIGQQRLMYVKLAFLAVAILEAGAAIFVYFKKREKLSK